MEEARTVFVNRKKIKQAYSHFVQRLTNVGDIGIMDGDKCDNVMDNVRDNG